VIDEKIITQLSVCPTCSKEVSGNYCSNCGERILADKQELRFSHFLKEAYHELFDLDSKFVRTLRYLFTRPGFLTLEILHGRKSIYIKPIRLYIMLVLLHFLAFSMIQSGDIFNVDRLPLMNFAPQLKEIILEKEINLIRLERNMPPVLILTGRSIFSFRIYTQPLMSWRTWSPLLFRRHQ
jgi:hypothetical protein